MHDCVVLTMVPVTLMRSAEFGSIVLPSAMIRLLRR